MKNNGEIRRVLGKSQKNIDTNQDEIEVNVTVNEDSSEIANTAEKQPLEINNPTKDAVSELIEESPKNNNDSSSSTETFKGNILVVILPIIILTIIFSLICNYVIKTTSDTTTSKLLQKTPPIVQKNTNSTLEKKQPELDTIDEEKNVEKVLSETEKQTILNNYKKDLVNKTIQNWHPEQKAFLIDNNISVEVHIAKNGSIECTSKHDKWSGQFKAMESAVGIQHDPLPEWYDEETLTFKLYFEGNEDLYWQRTKQIKPTYQVSLTPINFSQSVKNTKSTYDLVMEHTSGSEN